MLAARRDALPVASAAAATRTLPRDVASFTGRAAELAELTSAVTAQAGGAGVVAIHAIGGMAGIGKTTFAVHVAHQLAPGFPDGQFFLPLHAHTPGQRPVDPGDALASLLLTAGVGAKQIPPGLQARAGLWRDHSAGKKILLVLDDAAGHQQVTPLLPGTAGSLVLITSRRRLTALEDARAISLGTLPPGEAAALLARLSGRAALSSGMGSAGEITRLCGYLPLAIGMLARQLHHHPAWTAGGLAEELGAARDRLALMYAENLSVGAAFDLSYQDLTAGQQVLFRSLGLYPGTSIDAYAAAALADASLGAVRRDLDGLYDQHLITEPSRGRYRLHDLLSEHARALAVAGDPGWQEAALDRLLDYYLYTAVAAGKHIPAWTAALGPSPTVRPPCAPPVATARQAVAWLESEWANLHAAAEYAAASSRLMHAVAIPAAICHFLDGRGYWDQAARLQQTALTAASQAGDRPGQAQALMLLAGVQGMTGNQHAAAAANVTRALALYRDLGDRAGQGDAFNGLGLLHRMTGDYPASAACHRQAFELFSNLGHRRGQGDSLYGLGEMHRVTGNYGAAAAAGRQALELFRDVRHPLGEADSLLTLGIVLRLTGDYPAAASTCRQALALYRDLGDRYKQAWIGNQIGALQRLTGDYPAAAASHLQALEQFRDLGEQHGQGEALNELGLVQQLTGDFTAAGASHQQALELFRDTGEPYCEAEALNSLGELTARSAPGQQALELFRDTGEPYCEAEALNSLGELTARSAPGQHARDYHSQALALARAIGAPLEEARALEGIGKSHILDGNHDHGTAHLQEALIIYRRIGVPEAQRVQEALL